MALSVTVLGCNSAKPAYGRHPSAQVLNINERLYLIDCGEGTQVRMEQYKIRRGKINHIFITHLHGDHFLGLLGLLDTYDLSGRTDPMHLFGPPDLIRLIDMHKEISTSSFGFPLIFHPLYADKLRTIWKDDQITVQSFPLIHRVACTGFVFRAKAKDRKMRPEKIAAYNIPYPQIRAIKKGADFVTESGSTIPNSDLTADPLPPSSYAYCSDTAFTKSIIPYVHQVDILYHETTYLNNLAQLARERGHATPQQAALIARKAKVKKLMIGHFSSRYKDLQPFLEEAQAVFPNTVLAKEGGVFSLG